MIIRDAKFIKSSPSLALCPNEGLPEFAFVGRSNVGKSSFINYLVNRKKLARTSSSPGRTQLLNYYLINDAFYFVDLPGYGYAKVSMDTRRSWKRLMTQYLTDREELQAVFMVMDIRHEPSKQDLWMAETLRATQRPVRYILTKADKLSKSRRQQHASMIGKALHVTFDQVLIVSSTEKIGKTKFFFELANLLD